MKKNIILMGLPGAGKGTQAEKITAAYHIPHISTGDMFREAIANGTDLGKKAKSYMDDGNLVPDEVTNGIVKEKLASLDPEEGFMLDGYPRTLNQAEALEDIVKDLNTAVQAVIYIDVDPDALKNRLTGRIIDRETGKTYNIHSNPPADYDPEKGYDHEKYYQREDDQPEVVENRIQVNMEQTQPLLDFYEEKGNLYKVPGDEPIDQVFDHIKKIIES